MVQMQMKKHKDKAQVSTAENMIEYALLNKRIDTSNERIKRSSDFPTAKNAKKRRSGSYRSDETVQMQRIQQKNIEKNVEKSIREGINLWTKK